MDIYVLNTSFVKLGIIDYCRSIIWTTRYCDAGDFELYLPATKEAFELLQIDNLIMRADKPDKLMIIKSVELTTDTEDGNYLTITGPSIESYIAKRIVWSQTNLSGLVTNCITTLLNENLIDPTISDRKINNIAIGNYCDCNISIKKQITGDNLLDAIIEILSTYKYGFDVTLEDDTLLFNIYEGTDRSYDQSENPYVTFSPEFDNVLNSDYQADTSEYKNIAKVAGEGQGAARKTYVVGNAKGLDRDEIYVDARDISSDTEDGTLTPSEYNALLAEKGNEALADMVAYESYEAEIEPRTNHIFNQDYFLGDVVNLINDYGITITVRITEIIESWDENGYSCIPTFKKEEV